MVVFGWVLLVLLVLVALFCVVTWVLYVPLAARIFDEAPWMQPDSQSPLADAESCEFSAADGIKLSGSYLHTSAPKRLGVILFCHEFAGDRWGALPYVEDLRKRGFDIFTFDFRNHGTSERMKGYIPVPWLSDHSLADVRGAINYVCSREDADPRGVGLIGVSRGGNAALCAAADDSRVQALAVDGSFPLAPMQRHYMRRYMQLYVAVWWLGLRLPDFLLTSFCELAKFLAGWRRGCRFVNVERLVRRARQPVLMIHGERDTYVPVEVVHNLRSRLPGRSRLWVVPGAKHNGAIQAAPEEYHRRLARFFRKQLAPGRSRATKEPVLDELDDPAESAKALQPENLASSRS